MKNGKKTASPFETGIEKLPDKFMRTNIEKRGHPNPTMKKAKIDAHNCIALPNEPDIRPSNMFCETFGIVIAPRIPMTM